jgi:hypothetical protein
LINAQLFQQIEASARANIANAVQTGLATEPAGTKWSDAFHALTERFSAAHSVVLLTRVARAVYMIEPVNAAITSTKFACRWSANANTYFSFGQQNDPRRATFAQCEAIAEELLDALVHALPNDDDVSTLRLSINHKIISHELPLDYVNSAPDVVAIHQPGNLAWLWAGPAEATVKLRSWLLEQMEFQVPNQNATIADVMSAAISQKVAVKTYLTDRAQTGPYQTNREKRWEAHPASVQFASRAAASAIERELLEQLCFFAGFPHDCRAAAVDAGLLTERDITRCPITLDPLNFEDFAQEVLNPAHGRSKFQVGHLNPLKTVGRTNDAAGHTAQNIAWISAAGNRIQGDLSLADARALVQHIADNYSLLLPQV